MFNFSWTNKKDGDDIYAEHVNSLADGIKETQEAIDNISIDVDNEMSDTSTNAVQNKVVKTYIDESVGDVVETAEKIKQDVLDVDNKFEKWEKVVDVKITEPISPSFRQEFGKRFKKIRFKIKVSGTGTADNLRFKRDVEDGGAANFGSANFLKISSVNLATMRYIVGTAYFDLDNCICVKDGIYTTQTSLFAAGSTTSKSDLTYAEDNQFFDEIFFYFGPDCTISSGTVEVWGCEI